MNSIITLKRLIDLIAKQSGQPYSTAETFVKVFTSQVREALAAGEVVSIKGVGDFMITDDKKIVLVVDSELVSIINEPFSMFSPEELPEQTDAQLPVPEPQPESEQKPTPEQVPAPKPEPAPEPTPASAPVAAETTESSNAAEAPSQPRPAEPKPQYIPWSDEEEEDDEEEQIGATAEEVAPFPYFWTLIGAAAGLIIGLCLGFFAHDSIEELLEPSLAEEAELYSYTDSIEENADTLAVEPSAAISENEAEPKAQPEEAPKPQTPAATTKPASTPSPAATTAQTPDVYETVASGVTLAKLSKKHYKSDIYWVFIYLENKDVIKNPDNVPLGAKLRIPPLSKYAPQATESERRAAAQREIAKIRKK